MLSKAGRLSTWWMVGLLLFASCCRYGCMSEKDRMAMLTLVPEKPRFMSFIFRSYTGSRQHLLVAAREMLTARLLMKEDVEKEQGSELLLMEQMEGLPEHMMAGLTLKTHASIKQVLDAIHEIETMLADPKTPLPRQTVRIDLAWVQGVKMKSPELTLPSPELFNNATIGYYVGMTLHPFALEAMPDEDERESISDKIEGAPMVQNYVSCGRATLSESLALHRKPDHNRWRQIATNRADAFAAAGTAVGAALIERSGVLGPEAPPVDAEVAKELDPDEAEKWSDDAREENSYSIDRGRKAIEERRKIPLKKAIPIEISVDSKTSDDMLAIRWASEAQAASRSQRIKLGQVVVTTVAPGLIRGMLLGEPIQGEIAGVALLGARVEKSDESRNFPYVLKLRTGQLFDEKTGHK